MFTGTERTQRIIDALAEAKTGPTVFFVTTRGLVQQDEGRDRIEKFAAAGHLIANHSHRHPWLSELTLADYLADLDQAEGLIADFDNKRDWFRFPFLDEERNDLAKRDAMRQALADRGLLSGYVTVDTYDWHIAALLNEALRNDREVNLDALREVYVAMVVDAAEHYAELSDEWLGRQPAHVLLLHENDPAALFIADAVAGLRDAGWTIISPDEAYADPIAEQLPETLFAGMGRVSALAYDKGARGADTFDHWSASRKGIEERLATSGAIAPKAPN